MVVVVVGGTVVVVVGGGVVVVVGGGGVGLGHQFGLFGLSSQHGFDELALNWIAETSKPRTTNTPMATRTARLKAAPYGGVRSIVNTPVDANWIVNVPAVEVKSAPNVMATIRSFVPSTSAYRIEPRAVTVVGAAQT